MINVLNALKIVPIAQIPLLVRSVILGTSTLMSSASQDAHSITDRQATSAWNARLIVLNALKNNAYDAITITIY